jgi:hypothetical protein
MKDRKNMKSTTFSIIDRNSVELSIWSDGKTTDLKMTRGSQERTYEMHQRSYDSTSLEDEPQERWGTMLRTA